MEESPLLDSAAVAARLGVSAKTLGRWRCEGSGPPYVAAGGVVRYRRTDLDAWLAENTVQPQQPAPPTA